MQLSRSSGKPQILYLTRRVQGFRIMDSAQILGYVFGRRNMEKAVILDPNAPKNSSYRHYLYYFEKNLLREEGTGEVYFFYFLGDFFNSNIYKYIQKLAQNYLCWSNIRDFLSCTGQNTCKKGIYSVSILRIGFRSMCISL